MNVFISGVRPPFGMVRARGRGRSAAGSRAAGNKGLYLPAPGGGYPFNGFRGYYPTMRPGWYGDGYGKRAGRQEVDIYKLNSQILLVWNYRLVTIIVEIISCIKVILENCFTI